MFGPVPSKYRLIVWLCGLAAFVGLATLMAPLMTLPLSAPALALAGLGLGVVVVVLFLHDFEHHQPQLTRARARQDR